MALSSFFLFRFYNKKKRHDPDAGFREPRLAARELWAQRKHIQSNRVHASTTAIDQYDRICNARPTLHILG